jgi:hypothetical protein
MPKQWVSRTYTYSEPVDSDPNPVSNGIDGTDNLYGAGNRPDYDAGFVAGYRAGWSAGYEYARRLKKDDLAAEGTGKSPSFLL